VPSRVAGLLCLLAVAAPLAACRASNHPTSSSADGLQAVTKAQAVAFAREVNLRASDVSGWRAVGHEGELPREPSLDRCLGQGRSWEVAGFYSAPYIGGSGSMQSEVVVYRTPALAARALKLGLARSWACVGPHERRHTEHFDTEHLGTLSSVVIERESLSRLPSPLPGVTGARARHQRRQQDRDPDRRCDRRRGLRHALPEPDLAYGSRSRYPRLRAHHSRLRGRRASGHSRLQSSDAPTDERYGDRPVIARSSTGRLETAHDHLI
jgi:hypothetical protein